ncbi:D-alanyl-D-alanine carboxypeptidase family protein [Lacrimispora celerecrescens]
MNFKKQALWLAENCSRFGFVLRYPKEKENITGIRYEPEHFRYVGKTVAK